MAHPPVSHAMRVSEETFRRIRKFLDEHPSGAIRTLGSDYLVERLEMSYELEVMNYSDLSAREDKVVCPTEIYEVHLRLAEPNLPDDYPRLNT
jgi:hypothetical protein